MSTYPCAPNAPFQGPPTFGGGNDSLPTSTVELSVRCSDLCDTDLLSKSDPVCVAYMQRNGQWFELGRTEMIKDTLSPVWVKKFVVDYSFEERQLVKFEIYDWDSDSNRLNAHDFLGRCQTSLGTIVSASQFVSVIQDAPKTKGGKIYVVAEELTTSKEVVTMQLRAEKLDKKDFFGKSDPFFIISKAASGSGWTAVKKSEVIMKNLNPTWASFEISARKLCNGDHDRALKFDIYDWDSDGTHDYIGSFTTSLSKLGVAAIEQTPLACINDDKKRKKSSYKNSGNVFVKNFNIATQPTFLDYLQGGTAMNFSVAVDFTASNGNPTNPTSLHYRDPMRGGENQYTTAIRSVGEIIQDYDDDKQFPALGFGARVPPSGQVSHEFFLNLRPDTPYCAGVDGLLQAYFTALQNVQLYGPTNFSPVINHVANFARAYQQTGRQYFVLLILTDGIITDMEATKHAIVNASDLPMSIIIVGVGQEDFASMEELDSDDGLLQAGGGRKAARDIVQFVELRKFLGPGGNTWNKEMLAKEVLAEIPDQVVGWMKKRSIMPVTAAT